MSSSKIWNNYSEFLKGGIPENLEEDYKKCKHFNRVYECNIFKEKCYLQCQDNKWLKKDI